MTYVKTPIERNAKLTEIIDHALHTRSAHCDKIEFRDI